MTGNSTLTEALVKIGLPIADLSSVEDPRGRVDHLASKLIEAGVKRFAPELEALHATARPFIDGQLLKHLKGIKLPFFQGDV